MNKLNEEFDPKGLTVLSICSEDRETIVPFVEDLGAEFPIACKATTGAYSTGKIPAAYLIGADGTVVWAGNPGALDDDEIVLHLKNVEKQNQVSTWAFTIAKTLPALPAAMSGVDKLLEKKKFGAALKKVDACLPKLEGDEKEAGDKVREFIAGRAEAKIEQAAEMVRERLVYDAYLLLQAVEADFKGHALAKQAKDKAKALKSGKDTKLEFKASEKFAKIKKEMAEEKDPEDKLKVLKPLLSKKYAETKAGEEAAKIASDLESKVGK